MYPRHERRRPRNGRPVVALNLQQVHYHTGSAGYNHVDPVSQREMNVSTVPRTPPPPYEAHDFVAMQSGHGIADERPLRQRPSRPRISPSMISTTTKSPQPQDGSARVQKHPRSTTGPTESELFTQDPIVQSMNQGAALCDRVASVAARLSVVFTTIDEAGAENEDPFAAVTTTRGPLTRDAEPPTRSKRTLIDFSKTWLYANSRLPPHMPPFKVYISTWQIICAAAQASEAVYRRSPAHHSSQGEGGGGGASASYIDASVWHGTKAMTLHTQQVEVADKRLVVLAIRGSKWNPVDWAVNFRPAPTAATGFLDDDGNACHAGFLGVARNMVAPIAARLRAFVESASASSSPADWSLLLTGHSAGGAVASLLYAHMLSSARGSGSELAVLAGCFKRVHCVTFGAPPVSLLPLRRPEGARFAKSVFLAFANEGDPVVRADRQYVHTLVRLLAAPAPAKVEGEGGRGGPGRGKRRAPATWWEVPASTLSNAGRMVLLRERPGSGRRGTEAVQVTDEELRVHVFGDPAMHSMELYKLRVDEIAVEAVTGRRPG